MALILCIETSTTSCSIALAKNGQIIALKENNEGLNHSVLAAPYVEEILKEYNIEVENLDAVAVSMGPGSYTGLRIGVSLAKGLCYGANIPLISIPTLQALTINAAAKVNDPEALYIPMIDARRMEVYSAVCKANGEQITDTEAIIVEPNFYEEHIKKGEVYLFGNGSEKTKEILTSPNIVFIDKIETSAIGCAPIAERKFKAGEFEDVAYFEPFYLKDFITTTPKKRL